MSDVIYLDNRITHLDISAPRMLREIAKLKPENTFVIVWGEEGVHYHSNIGDMPEVCYRLHKFLHDYYNGNFSDND